MSRWTSSDIPYQTGKIAVITGGSTGLGFAAATALAQHGASVLLASRDTAKAERAAQQIGGGTGHVRLDLASLASVRDAAAELRSRLTRIDLLVNNAGVLMTRELSTEDGFELQYGTNHLGHFALTGLLLRCLLNAPAPRVVVVASGAHRMGHIKFDDLQHEHGYNNWLAYGQSKLANLLFCFELQRRATAAGSELRSVASHPGYSATNLQFAGPSRFYETALMAVTNRVVAQSAEMGALPFPSVIIWSGRLVVPRTGTYRFSIDADDAGWLSIDGNQFINDPGPINRIHAEGASELAAGLHRIQVGERNIGGDASIHVYWWPPGKGRELIPSSNLLPDRP